MRLLHIKQARSVWLFDIQDLNPKGKDVLFDAVDWIKEHYQFAVGPDLHKMAEEGKDLSAGAKFTAGNFQVREDTFIEIGALTLYNDGVVVDTIASSQDTDLFIGQLLQDVVREFGLVFDPDLIRKKLYTSTLVVRSDIGLMRLHPGFTEFANRISEAVGGDDPPKFHMESISFWSDPNPNGQHKIFSLMPQAGKQLSEHRYFSEAPLTTEDHYRLLEELERLVTAG